MTERFVPVHPARPPTYGGMLGSLIGKHARNGVAGWSELAFTEWYVRRRLLGTVVHIPRHPDMVERVLLANAANYRKPRLVKAIFEPFIGDGLFSAEGDLWRTQRKLAAPSFSPAAVTRLTGLMAQAAERHLAEWPEHGTVDIARASTHTTMRIITDALFAGDPRITTDEAVAHIENALIAVGRIRLPALLGFPHLRIGRIARRGELGRRYLRATLTQLVRERARGSGSGDFMTVLLHDLRDRFPAEQAEALAIDNAATFYVAGHETTANALAWTMYLLANVPKVQDLARDEAVAALRDGDIPTLPDRLPYLRQLLDETLRLYPPAPRIEREALADDDLGNGIVVRKGEHVSIWPWVIHRHRRLWKDADAFDPERFAPENEAGRHRFQYLPFGAGPRVCIGARFAVTEALVVLAHWLAARRFAPVHGQVPDPVATVTLRPQGGLPLEVTPV